MVDNSYYQGDRVLDAMSKYAINRNNLIEREIAIAFDFDKLHSVKKILEFGAGKGEFINRFCKYENLKTFSVEPNLSYVNILKQNHITHTSLPLFTERFDYIFTIDVLEHIENDLESLQQIYEALIPGGKLFIYVPARSELYSAFDKSIGHFRRYSKLDLTNKVTKAGFKIEKIRYHDFLGYFAAYYNKFFSRKNSDLNRHAVRIYDNLLVSFSNIIEKSMFNKPFIGKSLLVIASK
jgi:SAM-dependent methyltransferase